MIIIFPLASSDRTHAQAFLKLLQKFGPYPEDKALILPTPSAYHDPLLRPVVDGIQALFSHDNCKIEMTPNDFQSVWPFSPGCHFKFAMEVIDQMGWMESSLWMEPDLMPIREGWLKAVKDDYKMASTPFRGMLEKTRYIDTVLIKQPDGTMKAGARTPRYDGTIHFVGAGIYPPAYIQYLTPSKNGQKGSPMASYRNPSHFIPFDVKCQDQHVPATQSPLMLHRPRTVNWRRINEDTFTCEDRSQDEFGLTYAGTVSLKGVYLVHGCKDDSLAKAILEVETQQVFPETHAELWAPVTHSTPEAFTAAIHEDIIIPPALGNNEASREAILSERIQDLEDQNKMLQVQCQELAGANSDLRGYIAELSKPQAPTPPPMEEEPEPAPSQAPEKRKPGRPKGSGKVKAAAAA